jgi:medium-chain acyl-[acyl-carrier-protein] hydrolase
MFCFPYAGAGAGIFQDWQRSLPAEAELCLIQMPGRGARLSEPCCENVDEVILQLVPELTSLLDRPFVLYGHSMGALLAFMTARYLRNVCGLLPLQLIVSGASAPQIPRALPDIHTLPDAEFLQEIGRFNGTPKEILENAEIMSFMIPILRADFGLCNRYQYTPEAPLACPISVFGGIADRSVGKARLEAWREQTSSDFCLQMFPGDHFFLRSAQNIFLAEVARKLQIALKAELSA